MKSFVAVLLLIASFGACCDRRTKRIQSHWLQAPFDYDLFLDGTTRSTAHAVEDVAFGPVRDQRGNCAEHKELDMCIHNAGYGFWLDLTNKSGKPIRMLWPEARYVDEKGVGHEVFAQERGALPDDRQNLRSPPPELVAPSARTRPTIVPIYKQYLVASGCRDLYPYSEPLIPTRLDDKNEQQMKAYVDDLAKRQVPVKLLLPMEIDEKRYDYTFTFVLRDRWADLPKE